MDYYYLITPFAAWLFTGIIKFTINSIVSGRFAFDLIGYGGMPSNHSSIVSSAAAAIALQDGLSNPAFVVAVALTFIVVLDASSLRKHVGYHAYRINVLDVKGVFDKPLRERMGHSKLEIAAGLIAGSFSAWLTKEILTLLIEC